MSDQNAVRSCAPVGMDNSGKMYLDFVNALELCDAVTQCQKCASIVSTAMTNSSRTSLDLLSSWVIARVPDNAARWFDEQRKRLASKPTEKDVYLALGYATRRLGKSDLDLSPRGSCRCRGGAARLGPERLERRSGGADCLRLGEFRRRCQAVPARLEQLFRTADIGELITFYRGLPLYPGAEAARGPRARRCAQRHAADLRGGCAPQSLSAGAVRRERLEPHGAEGAVHRQQAGTRSRGSMSAPIRG